MSWNWLFNEAIQPEWAVALENRITKQLEELKMLVQVEQGDLDALDAALDDVTASISAKIDALVAAAKEPLPPAELSALQADIDTLRGLAAPTPPA